MSKFRVMEKERPASRRLRRKAATVGRGPLALVAVTVWATAVKTTLATLARY